MVFRRRRPRLLTCSFCGLDQSQVTKLIAGPAVHICGDCVELCNRIIAANGTPEAFPAGDGVEAQLALLRSTGATVDALSELLHERVAALRGRDVPWQRIADALGMSRQAAWERFR